MKLSVLLTPLVAVTAAGWLGVEGYYIANGDCPLSACSSQEGAVAAQPVTAVTGGDACCPTLAPAAIPVAVAPVSAPSAEGACCPSLAGTRTATTAEGAVRPASPAAASPGAVTPASPAATSPGAVCPTGATAATSAGAARPVTPTVASDGCCAATPQTAKTEGACAPSDACVPGDACGPNAVKDECTKTQVTDKGTLGLATPSPAMDCGPLDCEGEDDACCSGADIAPVDTQAPAAPRE